MALRQALSEPRSGIRRQAGWRDGEDALLAEEEGGEAGREQAGDRGVQHVEPSRQAAEGWQEQDAAVRGEAGAGEAEAGGGDAGLRVQVARDLARLAAGLVTEGEAA